MTSPGAVERARVGVRALPDTSVFARSLERYLQRVERTLRIELPVVLDDSDVNVKIQNIRERVENAPPVKLPFEVDGEDLARQREKYREETEKAPPVKVPTTAENPLDARFRAQLQAEVKKLTGQLVLEIPATPDGDDLRRELGTQIAEIEKQLRLEVPVAPAEGAEFRRKLREQIAAVEASLPPIKPDLSPEVEERDVITLRARIEQIRRRLSGANIEFDVGLDSDSVARLTAEVLALGAGLSALGLGALAGSAATGAIAALASEVAQAAGVVGLLPAAGFAAAAGLAAVAIGFQGVGDAIKAADDPEKFAQALENLSPEARKTAIAIKELGDEFLAVRLSVQNNLFAGIAQSVQELAARLLPSMQRGLSDVAAQLNAGTRAWVEFATSPRAVADLDSMFANISEAFRNLVPSGADFAAALTDIAAVGSGFLPGLSKGLADAGEKFRNFIAESRKSGELEAFIQRALDTLSQLGRIVANVAAGFGNIFAAGQARGATLLSIIEQITAKFRAFTESTEGQEAIGDFFQAATQAVEALLPVLGSLFTLFASNILPILAEIGTIVGPAVTTVLNAIGQALQAAQPGITAFASGFAAFLEAVAPALPAVGELARVLGTSLGVILERLGPVIGEVATVLSTALAEALSNPALIDGIVAMGQAFGEILVAIAPLLPQLAELAGTVLKGLAQVLVRIGPPLADMVGLFLDALLPVLPDLVDAFLALVDAFAPIAEDLGRAFVAVFEALAPILPPLVTAFTAFVIVLTPIIDVIATIIEAIADFIGWLLDLGETAFNTIDGLNRLASGVETSWKKASDSGSRFGRDTEGSLNKVSAAAEGTRGSLEKAASEGSFWMGSLAGSSESSFQRIDGAQRNYLKELEKSLIPGFLRMRDTGSASFWAIASAASGAVDASINETRRLAETARKQLHDATFAAEGGRLTKSLADGMVSSSSMAAIQNAAKRVTDAIAAWFPSSPAKKGPFSGTGWTPYRGRALAEGLADGMLARLDAVRAAAGQLADAANSNLGVSVGVGGGGGGGTTTFNVYGAPGQSEESLAYTTSRIVAWETKKSVTP